MAQRWKPMSWDWFNKKHTDNGPKTFSTCSMYRSVMLYVMSWRQDKAHTWRLKEGSSLMSSTLHSTCRSWTRYNTYPLAPCRLSNWRQHYFSTSVLLDYHWTIQIFISNSTHHDIMHCNDHKVGVSPGEEKSIRWFMSLFSIIVWCNSTWFDV